jgi:hypothetical protein
MGSRLDEHSQWKSFMGRFVRGTISGYTVKKQKVKGVNRDNPVEPIDPPYAVY